MGFRLYVNDNICCGKLYGYNANVRHLYSIDYLISIGAFDQWLEPLCDLDLKTCSYDDMVYYFCLESSTDDIYLNPDEYRRFIVLYTSDQAEEWNEDSEAICEMLSDRLPVTPDKNGKITLYWE